MTTKEKDKKRLLRQFDTIERSIPTPFARLLKFLRHPAAMLIRIPLGFLLVLGGILSFLPVLGIWMLPLGLLLLSVDVVLLRRPITRAITRLQNWLRQRGRKRNARSKSQG